MIFLRLYEILVEANQSILDRRDVQVGTELSWDCFDAGYPFCYFTGETLNDLLRQPIIWRQQHLVLERALWQLQPDLERWLTSDVRDILVNDFFGWMPHTRRVQELVDDVKQRVLDVVDAIHSAEKLQRVVQSSKLLRICLPDSAVKKITTGGLTHSLTYRLRGEAFEPVLRDAGEEPSRKWYMHALIHGMWLAGQEGGHVYVDAEKGSRVKSIEAPLLLV